MGSSDSLEFVSVVQLGYTSCRKVFILVLLLWLLLFFTKFSLEDGSCCPLGLGSPLAMPVRNCLDCVDGDGRAHLNFRQDNSPGQGILDHRVQNELTSTSSEL